MMTGAGMLLGTAAYISPEQARGKPVGKRADIGHLVEHAAEMASAPPNAL